MRTGVIRSLGYPRSCKALANVSVRCIHSTNGNRIMKFNIYGRFQVEVRRENNAWMVYRSESGKRTLFDEVVVPPDLVADELVAYLDDIFHEYAGFGENVTVIPD
jgi:hypothetical protein